MPVEMKPQEVQHRSISPQYYNIHERIVQYVKNAGSFPTKNHVVVNHLSRSLPTEPSQKALDLAMQISSKQTIHRQDDPFAKRFVSPSHFVAQTIGKESVPSFNLDEAYNAMLHRIKERLTKENNQTDAPNDRE